MLELIKHVSDSINNSYVLVLFNKIIFQIKNYYPTKKSKFLQKIFAIDIRD